MVGNKFLCLRGAMCAHGDTQHELAKALKLSYPSVNQRMNARGSAWRLDEMYAIMKRYNIPTNKMHLYFPENGIDVKEAKS